MSRKRPLYPSTYPALTPPLELEDVLGDIFARIADPATLACASLVNRNWYNAASASHCLDSFRERQPIRLVGFFSQFEDGNEFSPLPLPPELRHVSRFLLEVFPNGLDDIQDIFAGHILFNLDDSLHICNPFMKVHAILPLAPCFQHAGYRCGDFYLFKEESVVHVDVIIELNLMHVQLSVHCDTWITNHSSIALESTPHDETLCRPALCVDEFIYMLSVNGFVVKLKTNDCSLSLISLPNGSYEWGFQRICRANGSDFMYVHVDGFSIQVWSYLLNQWRHVNNIYLPSFFEHNVEVIERLSYMKWDESRRGWGEVIKLYGTTDGADHIFMGFNDGVVEDLYLMDIRNENLFKIGPKVSNENGELIGNCISPLVTSWVPIFPSQQAAEFSSSTIAQFKRHQSLDISSLRSCELNQYNVDLKNSPHRNYQIVVGTQDMGIVTNGLPWKLFDNLAFFNELTLPTSDSLKKNAVIMERKSWESIPLTSRPLPGRLNVIFSQSDSFDRESVENVVFCGSLNSALEVLSVTPYCLSIERVFIIEGAQIMRKLLNGPTCDAIHLIHIHSSVKRNTFIPPVDFSVFQPWYSSLPLVESNTRYSFVTFVRIRKSVAESHHLNGKKSIEAGTVSDKFDIQNFSFLPKMIFDHHEEYHYLNFVDDIIRCGSQKSDSMRTPTLSKFGCQMRFNLRRNFPLLTTKRVLWDLAVENLLWFISGSTNAKVSQDKNIHIWNDNASREYLHRSSDMHADYTGKGFDQLMDVIDKIKNNLDDRQIILSAWNPSDLKKMGPPCHMFAQFYVENGELSCQMYQTSADMGHDVPFNIASYSLLTCTIAQVCDLCPGDFIHVIGDAHVYGTHVGSLEEQIQKLPKPFPILEINPLKKDINSFVASDFKLDGYNPHEET